MSKMNHAAVLAACLLSACGGGGGGGDTDAPRSLAQEVGPSPHRSPTAAILAGPATAESAVTEVLAGYAEVEVAARYSNVPVPTGFDFSEVPAGRNSESCGGGGSVTLTAPSRMQTGSQMDMDFKSCSFNGVLLNGSMLIELTAYTSDFDNAFAIAAEGLSIQANGQTFPSVPGLIGCNRFGSLQCYFSRNKRGWATASLTNGDAGGRYAVAWGGGGSVHVTYNALDVTQRTGHATVTGLNGASVTVQPTLTQGVYQVTVIDTMYVVSR